MQRNSMTEPSPFQEIDRKQLQDLRDRFLKVNLHRLERIQWSLWGRQLDFFRILPVLLHVNHPILPGYQTNQTPSGIADFNPGKQSLNILKSYARSFKFNKKAVLQPDILGLYLMGSPGSLGFSGQSDFDFWVCHRPDLEEAQLQELRLKLEAISKFAETLGLEVHLFCVNPDTFKKGVVEPLSKESSGSAQHFLLLDEFYRSSIHIAGLCPIWWVVPAEQELHYERYVERLMSQRHLRQQGWIDFGSVANMPADEFLGASLWQLYKAIESPYKSILKLLLMESYSDTFPHTVPLSLEFKKRVQGNEMDCERLDPYIMMYQQVEEYLSKYRDNRLEVVRRSLYFKANLKLSVPSENRRWQRELLSPLTRRWGWSPSYLRHLDNQKFWRVSDVQAEYKSIIDSLTIAYRKLNQFAKAQVRINRITQRELLLLQRKLYSAFQRKTGKIELFNQGISSELNESVLSFHEIQEENQTAWLLYSGAISKDLRDMAMPVKKRESLVSLLTWCFYNGILSPRSQYGLYKHNAYITAQQLKQLTHVLEDKLPRKLSAPTQEKLLQDAYCTQIMFFINIGRDILAPLVEKGFHLVAELTDPICYSAEQRNLIQTIDIVMINSWHEIFCYQFSGNDALSKALLFTLKNLSPSPKQAPKTDYYCSGINRADSIRKRFQEIVERSIKLFYQKSHSHYILEMNKGFRCIEYGNRLDIHSLDSMEQLNGMLSERYYKFKAPLFDKQTHSATLLERIYQHNEPDCVQFFLYTQDNNHQIYVLDEAGILFHRTYRNIRCGVLLTCFRRFFNNISFRLLTINPNADELNWLFFRIFPENDMAIEPLNINAIEDNRYHAIEAIASSDTPNSFTLYHDHREYSPLVYGDKLFQALKSSVNTTHSNTQPMLIVDLDVPIDPKEQIFSTTQYLQQKALLEFKLNK